MGACVAWGAVAPACVGARHRGESSGRAGAGAGKKRETYGDSFLGIDARCTRFLYVVLDLNFWLRQPTLARAKRNNRYRARRRNMSNLPVCLSRMRWPLAGRCCAKRLMSWRAVKRVSQPPLFAPLAEQKGGQTMERMGMRDRKTPTSPPPKLARKLE